MLRAVRAAAAPRVAGGRDRSVLASTACSSCLCSRARVPPMRTPAGCSCSSGSTPRCSRLLGLIFGPLLIMPIFFVGSLAGFAPATDLATRRGSSSVAHAAPDRRCCSCSRWIGVLPATFHVIRRITGVHAVGRRSDSDRSRSLLFGRSRTSASTMHITGVTLIGKRAEREAAQDHQHAVAWHLGRCCRGRTTDRQLGRCRGATCRETSPAERI